MIFYVAPISSMLDEFNLRFDAEWRKKIKFIRYEQLGVKPGTWIFTEPTRSDLRQKLIEFERKLLAAGCRVMNSPAHALTRLELLERLNEEGINSFRAFNVLAANRPWRYPVFIRELDTHKGSATGLLHSNDEFDSALSGMTWNPDLMTVEYAGQCGADGLFRKYSVMRVGDEYIPRHILFSKDWIVKKPDEITPELAAEELAFCDEPVLPEVKRAFDVANIQFGRIDYGMLNGRPQIWEINTLGTIVPERRRVNKLRHASQDQSAVRIKEAMERL